MKITGKESVTFARSDCNCASSVGIFFELPSFRLGEKIKERGKKEKMRKVHGINNITDITSGRNFGKREMHFFLISVLRTVTIRSMTIQ